MTIDILDPSGKVVRSFAGAVEKKKEDEDATVDDDEPKAPPKPAMKAGLNRYTWDMHTPGYTEFKGMIFWAGRNRGPVALPGQYQVRLTVDGQTQVQPAEVRLDRGSRTSRKPTFRKGSSSRPRSATRSARPMTRC